MKIPDLDAIRDWCFDKFVQNKNVADYAKTMDILNAKYTPINLFNTTKVISNPSSLFVTTPSEFNVDGNTGRITFNNTGNYNMQKYYISSIDLDSQMVIPSGSRIIFNGKSDGLIFVKRSDIFELDDGLVTTDLTAGELSIQMKVVTGKTYDISCIPQVWIPQT